MHTRRVVFAMMTSLAMVPGCMDPMDQDYTEEELSLYEQDVVAGSVEPNANYPWTVLIDGGSCRGVLIDPQWVLTAAHCVTQGLFGGRVSYIRTDPYTGSTYTETRDAVMQTNGKMAHLYPQYQEPGVFDNDIALVQLQTPFTINQYLQTVAIPKTPRVPGVIGTVASFNHTGPLPAGQAAIFRAPIPAEGATTSFNIHSSVSLASLCPGDSGSGFVTNEGGRATVRGIASNASVSDCMTPFGEATFTDAFAFHDWILQTMNKTDATLEGNTRVRWSGKYSRGVIGLGCNNPNGTMWGPLNVAGVQEGANCPSGETQAIICSVSSQSQMVVKGFTMKTTAGDGSVTVQKLPFSKNWASYFGMFPAGVTREFTCQIGYAFVVNPGDWGGVFTPI